MIIDDGLLRQIESDLGINVRYYKGQSDIPVRDCWHFSTDGHSVDAIFRDEEDFKDGMNRIALLTELYKKVVILAFALMDNHIHFVLYSSSRAECDKFTHEYIRRTSICISRKYGERHKLNGIPVSCQKIDTQSYLKMAVCYVLRNPTYAGLPVSPFDYPWSSGPLMFRAADCWSSACWKKEEMSKIGAMGAAEGKAFFKSHGKWNGEWRMTGGIVFPGEYVAYEIVERLFRTHKAYLSFMGSNKEHEVESMSGRITSLSIPDQEMRQYKNEAGKEIFGTSSLRNLNTSQRIILARKLRSRYQCSVKQISRVCGLVYEEVKDLL